MTMPLDTVRHDKDADPLEIVTVPCLSDNYAYLIKGPDGVAVVDAPEAAPLINALDTRGWKPEALMITHHHPDHHGGTKDLRARFPSMVVMGPKAEADRLPTLDLALEPGFEGGSGTGRFHVLQVPGHTLGHIAYYYPDASTEGGALFSADSLMVMGCGRLFEGTPAQMWDTLQRLMTLPDDTLVYPGHEYTQSNTRFALEVEPDNADLVARAAVIDALRAEGRPTVPAKLGLEKATNPFLRAHLDTLKNAVGMAKREDAEVFAHIRAWKDRF
ncbi:MAG: hydroxyacylglutathione hydrolase [Epibacterium sp.]|nr:hydroxyacylglutathione hydrolase [Epibacterium sp.]